MEDLYSAHFDLGPTGTLRMDGVELSELAETYGTPLYVMSEAAIRQACHRYVTAMGRNFSRFKVAYASKALCASFLYPILESENMHADVVSGGELYTALNAGFPAEKLHLHGNNKTVDELEYAVHSGIGSVVIDSLGEIAQLDAIAGSHGAKVNALFRVKPGVEAHTHESIMTGQNDCKFGFGIEDGEGLKAARAIHAAPNLNFRGLHCHIGSQIFGTESYAVATDKMIAFTALINRELNIALPELILGGGFGVRYMPQDNPVDTDTLIDSIGGAVKASCAAHGVPMPEVVIEPGRSIVGPAGCTLYTVGGVKDIVDARCYVTVDGSMSDNPRYALYDAQYDACVVSRAGEGKTKLQTIAGRCCETGDMISRDIALQPARAGDILCVYTTGAYNYAMSMNYNRLPRPAMVLVTEGGSHRTVIRRETWADMVRCDAL